MVGCLPRMVLAGHVTVCYYGALNLYVKVLQRIRALQDMVSGCFTDPNPGIGHLNETRIYPQNSYELGLDPIKMLRKQNSYL